MMILRENDLMELELAPSVDPKEMLKQLQAVPPDEWSSDYQMIRQEVQAILLEQSSEEVPVSAGCMSELPAGDDMLVFRP